MVSSASPARLWRTMFALAVAIFAMIASPARAGCEGWDPAASASGYGARPIVARDLIDLVNFGRPDIEPLGGPSAFGISPDGRWVATVLQRADVATNGFCQALLLIDRLNRVPPRLLDRGGEFLLSIYSVDDHYDSSGIPRLNAARFSHDGNFVAYLKRVDDQTRLWVVGLNGRSPMAVTPAKIDVTRWAWRSADAALIYGFEPGSDAAAAAVEREGLGGWHFDRRMAPMLGFRPQIPAPLTEVFAVADAGSGTSLPASTQDSTVLHDADDIPLEQHRVSVAGRVAWARQLRDLIFSPRQIEMRDANGVTIPCIASACRGRIAGLWWTADGKSLIFLRSEGWNDRFTTFYRWSPRDRQPQRILQTDDVIEGCTSTGAELTCLRQGATQPPRLVAIEVGTGRQRIVFDPNPGFSSLLLGHVERLEWRNNVGRQVYGDLVLPPGYAGGRLPTIVVLYRSRGFLRGGTGNDYPIQLFASRGFAVLSVDRPALFAQADQTIGDDETFWRANLRGWADRRSVDSAIQSGLDLLVARLVADPARLALTGLSDGSSSVRFALIGSRRYAAAAISTCCVDEVSDDLAGPGWLSQSSKLGYPPAAPVDESFWRAYSLALNASEIKTPLLMQLADTELLTSLHAYTALQAAGQPVDLYFYPDEFHFKWQPMHRQAVYERNLDWFSFWLQRREDPRAAKTDQYSRWRSLRDRMAPKSLP